MQQRREDGPLFPMKLLLGRNDALRAIKLGSNLPDGLHIYQLPYTPIFRGILQLLHLHYGNPWLRSTETGSLITMQLSGRMRRHHFHPQASPLVTTQTTAMVIPIFHDPSLLAQLPLNSPSTVLAQQQTLNLHLHLHRLKLEFHHQPSNPRLPHHNSAYLRKCARLHPNEFSTPTLLSEHKLIYSAHPSRANETNRRPALIYFIWGR